MNSVDFDLSQNKIGKWARLGREIIESIGQEKVGMLVGCLVNRVRRSMLGLRRSTFKVRYSLTRVRVSGLGVWLSMDCVRHSAHRHRVSAHRSLILGHMDGTKLTYHVP